MSETEGRKPGLEEARKEIDRIDREMAALYQRRMETVEAVADWKKRHDLPVFQPEREAAILEKDAAWVKPAYRDSWVQLLKTMMAQSRAHQQRRICRDVVACQGMEGAFSHMAARGRFPDAMLQSHPTFEAVIQAVLGGSAQYGVIPLRTPTPGWWEKCWICWRSIRCISGKCWMCRWNSVCWEHWMPR